MPAVPLHNIRLHRRTPYLFGCRVYECTHQQHSTAADASARLWQSLFDSRQLTLRSLLRVPLSLTRYRQANVSVEDLARSACPHLEWGYSGRSHERHRARRPEPDRFAASSTIAHDQRSGILGVRDDVVTDWWALVGKTGRFRISFTPR